MSLEEKRKRLNDLFLERKEFFQLKELETIAPKTKGIVVQTVKEVLQGLVDDRLVQCEKIGTSNYYWSFPSVSLHTRKMQAETLQEEIDKLERTREELGVQIEQAQSTRQNSVSRALS